MTRARLCAAQLLGAAPLLLTGPARAVEPAPTTVSPAAPLSSPPPAQPLPPSLVPIPFAAPVAPWPPPPAPPPKPLKSFVGVQAALGFGATGFILGGTRAVTGPGWAWDVRGTVGTLLSASVELAYVGSVQPLHLLSLSSDSRLVGNGVEAAARINLTRTNVLQPYIFGGIGWIHYQITNASDIAADRETTDNVSEIPLGAGLTARVAWGLVLDLRFTGRLTFHDTLFDSISSPDTRSRDLHSWNIGEHVGWEF